MMRRAVSGLVLLALHSFGSAALCQDFGLFPDQGEVEGKAALAFVALSPASSADEKPTALDPRGLKVHLVRMENQQALSEIVLPAGTWVAPPRGTYRYWIEGNGWISPSHGILHYSAEPFRGRGGIVARRMVPAGTVQLEEGEVLGPNEELRLLHIDSHLGFETPLPEMSRRVGQEAFQGVAMPAGRLLAGVFDRTRDEYRWLSRPVTVPADGTAKITAPTESTGTTVLAILERPQALRDISGYDTELTLKSAEGMERVADLQIPTAERVYGVFYDQGSRVLSLGVRSPSTGAPPVDLALRPGKVETYRGFLRSLPSLKVNLTVPHDLKVPQGTKVALLEFPERLPLLERPLDSDLATAFDHVPPRLVEAVIESPPWRFTGRIDLSDWQDGELELVAEPLRIRGTVFQGETPSPAHITFQTFGGDPKFRLQVETDAEGNYEVLLYRPPSFALIKAIHEEPTRKPHWEVLLEREFGKETHLDFRIPDNRVYVEVADRDSGEPIEGATVRYRNLHVEDDEKQGKYHGRVTTDPAGSALLPALRSGALELHVSADGFRSTTLEDVTVATILKEKLLQVELEPESSTLIALSFLQPRGAAARGAEVVVLDGVGNGQQWAGRANDEGKVLVPERLANERFLARTAGAGFLIDRLPNTEQEFIFPATYPPLRVQILDNGDPSPWARVAIEIQGTTLSGPSLQWLTGASSADAAGIWQARGLPRAPMALVAWHPGDDANRDAVALLASFGRSIDPSNWSETLELDAVK